MKTKFKPGDIVIRTEKIAAVEILGVNEDDLTYYKMKILRGFKDYSYQTGDIAEYGVITVIDDNYHKTTMEEVNKYNKLDSV